MKQRKKWNREYIGFILKNKGLKIEKNRRRNKKT